MTDTGTRRELTMEAPVGEVNLSRLERVISGPGKIEALANELDRRNLKRAIVVTGKTLGKSPLLAKVTGALGAVRLCFHRRPPARADQCGARADRAQPGGFLPA